MADCAGALAPAGSRSCNHHPGSHICFCLSRIAASGGRYLPGLRHDFHGRQSPADGYCRSGRDHRRERTSRHGRGTAAESARIGILRSRSRVGMKSKTNAAVLLLGTFLLGAVSGAVSFSLYRSHVNAASPKKDSQPSGPNKIVEELARGLAMDSVQKEKLAVIIKQSRDRYRALSKQFRPQYDTIRDQ